MKLFLIPVGAFLLGLVVAEAQLFFGRKDVVSVPLANNVVWGTAFAMIAAGLCM